MGARGALSEDEAVRLFAACARDARGGPVDDERAVRRIVALLSYNRAAIQLAAARAREMSLADIAASLEQLDASEAPAPDVRSRLARGQKNRLLGRLGEASSDLEAVLRDARGDPHAEAEAHRLLGAVYRAQGRPNEALEHKEKALALFTAIGDPVRRAVAHGELGTALAALGRLREARVCHEQALAAHRELGQRTQEGVELSYLGVTFHRLGLLDEARRAHEAALEIHRETKNRRSEGADNLHLGYVAHEKNELGQARARFDAALVLLRDASDRALEGVALSYAGALEVEAGRPEVAGPLLQQALAINREVMSPRHEAITRMHLAYHHAALGEDDEAESALERAIDLGAGLETETRAWLLALLDRFDEARALRVEDPLTERAIRLLELHSAPMEARGALAEPRVGTRVRLAARRLERALASRGATMEIAPDGRAFVGPDGVRVDLARRRPLRLALALLAARREAAPGVGVGWQELLAAAWPGERVGPEAGFARVRNALSTLRKMGLRDVLLTRDDGYLLDPSVAIKTREI